MPEHSQQHVKQKDEVPKLSTIKKGILYAVLVVVAFVTVQKAWPITALIVLFFAFKGYEAFYFRSAKFNAIKTKLAAHIQDCNNLCDHINKLQSTTLSNVNPALIRGHSTFFSGDPNSQPQATGMSASNVYECTRNICDASRRDPVQYVCKYFLADADRSLPQAENMLNNFAAAADCSHALIAHQNEMVNSILDQLPLLIRTFSKGQVARQLGCRLPMFSRTPYPTYVFRYQSSAQGAEASNTVTLDLLNLDATVNQLFGKVQRHSRRGSNLVPLDSQTRQKVFARDGNNCQRCGVNLHGEPNMVLEVGLITPFSAGGSSEMSNLTTLCWRCNCNNIETSL